ncbi:MAG: YqiA/YcfP family alpha/beta fold hydrolase [Pseudomonadota bacterium]
MTEKHLVFSHGMESGPWGTKITAMARVARALGWTVESLDYSHTLDPDERVGQLLDYCAGERWRRAARRVFVGSSMGGYVATVAGQYLPAAVRPDGLFLLAPAFYMGPWAEQWLTDPARCTTIIHGWRDDVVPVDNSLRYARQHGCDLQLLDDGHRLIDSLPAIEERLRAFLANVERQ